MLRLVLFNILDDKSETSNASKNIKQKCLDLIPISAKLNL